MISEKLFQTVYEKGSKFRVKPTEIDSAFPNKSSKPTKANQRFPRRTEWPQSGRVYNKFKTR